MTSLAHFEKVAQLIDTPHLAVIDGRLQPSVTGKSFDNVTPRNGTVINRVAECGAEDVDAAVKAGRRAFEDGRWRNLHYREKKRVLFALADLIERDTEMLAVLESLDVGKPIKDALGVDIPQAVRTLRYYAEALDKIYGEVGPGTSDRFSFTVHEPLGVIGAIVPWNFPLHMAMWKVAGARHGQLGCAEARRAVADDRAQTRTVGARGRRAARRAQRRSRLRRQCRQSAGAAHGCRHDHVHRLRRGGPVVDAILGQSNLKRVGLELGGKSPQIVFADCPDLKAAALHAAWGIFFNQGEVCTAASRLLVQDAIADAFLDELLTVAKAIVPGDPLEPETQFGAMVSAEQMQTALRFIDIATREGAALRLGGKRARIDSGGFYVEPTVFDKVAPEAALARRRGVRPSPRRDQLQ